MNATATKKFNDVYVEYHSRILKFINYRINLDLATAEELTNDVFMKVNEHLAIFDCDKSKLNTWIHSIAKNIIIDHYRKMKNNTDSINKVNADGVLKVQIYSNDIASDLVEGKELQSAINTAMNKLKNKQKQIAELYFFHNMKYVEIAELLDIPLNSVKVTLLRAKEELQYSLKNVYKYSIAV